MFFDSYPPLSSRMVKDHLQKIMEGKLDSRRHKLFLDPRHVGQLLSITALFKKIAVKLLFF